MAVLRLEVDIDSEVHPELYAKLASIERRAAREEKLRQLAATGLIWEIIRLHGPAFTEPGAVVEPPRQSAADVAAEASSEVRADTTTHGPAPDLSDAPAVDAGAASDHEMRVPENVPLLIDVVDEGEMPGVDARVEGPIEPAPGGILSLRHPTPAPEPSDIAHADVVHADAPMETHGGKARSARMKRMKDMGLFQNG